MHDATRAEVAPGTRLDGFVSYSRRDATSVLPLIEEAERLGRSLWLDADDIPAGTPWREELGNGIEAADSFLACLSDHWLASTECRKEYDQAVDLGKRLVPVVVGDLDTGAVPAPLAVLQWVQARDRDTARDPRVRLRSHRRRPGAGPGAHALARARTALGAPRPGPLAARARAGAAVRRVLARPAGRQPRTDAVADAVRDGQQERRARPPANAARGGARGRARDRGARCGCGRAARGGGRPAQDRRGAAGGGDPAARHRQVPSARVGGPRPDRCRPGASAPHRQGGVGHLAHRRGVGGAADDGRVVVRPRHRPRPRRIGRGGGLGGRPGRRVDRARRAAPGVRRQRRLEPRRGHARPRQAAVLRCDTGRRPRPGHVAFGHRVGVASGRRRPTGADAGPDPPRRDGRGRLAESTTAWSPSLETARRPCSPTAGPARSPSSRRAPTRRSRRLPRAAGSSPSAR